MPIQSGNASAPNPLHASPIAFSSDWRLCVIAAAIFVIGLGISIFAAVVTDRAITKEARTDFDQLCGAVVAQAFDRINRIGRGLNGARGIFATGIEIDRATFKAYVEARNFSQDFPGAMGMGFIQRVPRGSLEQFVRETRADGNPTYTYRLIASGESLGESEPITYPIKYIFPEEPNREALGIDVGSEGGRRRAIERAIDSGQPRISRRIELVQAQEQAGFLFFVPVYRAGTHPETPEERRRDLVGVLYAPVVLKSALDGLVPDDAPFNLTLTDLAVTAGDPLIDFVGDRRSAASKPSESRFRYEEEEVVGGRTWRAEFLSKHNFDDGTRFFASPLIGFGGCVLTTLICTLLLVVGGGRDRAIAIAEKTTAELRESERKARAVFDQTFQFIGLLDREGRIIEANQTALDFAGIQAKDVLGTYFPDTPWWLHSPEVQGRLRQAIADALRGEFVRFETTHPGADGDIHYVDFSLKPVFDDHGEVMWLLPEGRDISDIKKIQQAYKAAKEAAEAANRFKSEFLANMSHEIRTPMTAILGYADLLPQMITGQSPELIECVSIIRRHGEHLLDLINGVLDLSKIEAGQMTVEPIDVSPRQILHAIESLMSGRARDRGIGFVVELATDIPAVIHSDPTKLKQILINLVANAIKFTEHGAVTIRAGYQPESPYGPAVTFAVTDTGIGIQPENMPRLFEAFRQADGSITRKFGGTGLGLRISGAFAKLLGGDITVESEFGKGSTFTVFVATGTIPNAPMLRRDTWQPPSARPTVASPSDARPRPLEGLRIFLVEDSLPIQKLIGYHLVRAGAEVHAFSNGHEALASLCTEGNVEHGLVTPPPCDLVVTDIQMPIMDGYTLARSLRAKGALLPIIGLTAHATPADAAACMEAGCNHWATKPIDPAALIDLCCQAVSNERAEPEEFPPHVRNRLEPSA
jgi:PAS domain S-box-containing protein